MRQQKNLGQHYSGQHYLPTCRPCAASETPWTLARCGGMRQRKNLFLLRLALSSLTRSSSLSQLIFLHCSWKSNATCPMRPSLLSMTYHTRPCHTIPHHSQQSTAQHATPTTLPYTTSHHTTAQHSTPHHAHFNHSVLQPSLIRCKTAATEPSNKRWP